MRVVMIFFNIYVGNRGLVGERGDKGVKGSTGQAGFPGIKGIQFLSCFCFKTDRMLKERFLNE